MRCEVCGRPYDGEVLKAGEIACQGCHDERAAAIADMTPDFEAMVPVGEEEPVMVEVGEHRTYTDEQASALARQLHCKREEALMRAVILERYERNAAGLHGATGAPLALSGAELATVKAHAAKMVSRFRGL